MVVRVMFQLEKEMILTSHCIPNTGGVIGLTHNHSYEKTYPCNKASWDER